MSTASAARSLVAARREAGLSQDQLAVRSEVSERTIRSLESGNAKRPHRDTLVSVGRALGKDEDELEVFVALWRAERREVEQLLAGRHPLRSVHDEVAAQRERVRERAMAASTRIGPDGRWQESRFRRRFEVLADGVDRFIWVNGFDRTALDPERVRLTEWVNIEPSLEIDLPESGAKAFVGLLRQTLHRGAVYEFEYVCSYRDAYRPGAAPTSDDNDFRFAFVAPLDALSIEVRFDPSAVPQRVWLSRQDGLDTEPGAVSDVAVSPFGVAQVQLQALPAGVHGLRWDWD